MQYKAKHQISLVLEEELSCSGTQQYSHTNFRIGNVEANNLTGNFPVPSSIKKEYNLKLKGDVFEMITAVIAEFWFIFIILHWQMNPSGALTFRFLCNKKYFGHNNSKDSILGKQEQLKKNIPKCMCVSVWSCKTNYRPIQLKINIYKEPAWTNCIWLGWWLLKINMDIFAFYFGSWRSSLQFWCL